MREIVRLGADGRLFGRPPGEIEHLPERALGAVDLGRELFRALIIRSCPGGEQQRVQLAARTLPGLVTDALRRAAFPVILDEPVSSPPTSSHQIAIMRFARDYAMHGGGGDRGAARPSNLHVRCSPDHKVRRLSTRAASRLRNAPKTC